MQLQRALELAEEELKKHEPRTLGWRFEFDAAERRFGCCFYVKKLITISRVLTELNSEEQFLDTLRHEIAHAIAGFKAGHGHDWKLVCVMTGAKPIACYNPAVVNCSRKDIALAKIRQLDDVLKFKL